MLRSALSILVVLIGFAQSGCNEEELDIRTVEDLETYLQDEMDLQRIPALSVVLFNENGVILERYYGQSNMENDVDLGADHVFLLASVSKVITATALLQLHDDGLFELDDPINDHLPFQVNVPGQSTPVTFRMLLTHTSAIADADDALDSQYYYGQDSPMALSTFLEQYLVPGGQFYNATQNFTGSAPGSEHEYSNMGTALIGVLVENISGTDFNSYCKQNIFGPLGMNDTFWRLDESVQAGNALVMPYDLAGNSPDPVGHYTNTDYPNGGLRSTGRDLATLLMTLANGGLRNGYRLLEAQTVQQMITPQIPQLEATMGLHMFLMNNELGLWGHDGGEQGVATTMAYHPTTRVGAVILTNQGEADPDEMLAECYKLALLLE